MKLSGSAGAEHYPNPHLVAANPHTPAALLENLSTHSDPLIRTTIAGNPNCSEALLVTLATDRDLRVRSAVAKHPNTPVNVLHTFAASNDPNLFHALTKNPNTLTATLDKLAHRAQTNDHVASWLWHYIAQHPNTSETTMTWLANTSPNLNISLCDNPNVPAHLLDQISQTCCTAELNSQFIQHKNTPLNVIIRILTKPTGVHVRRPSDVEHAFNIWREHILAGTCTDVETAEYYALRPNDAEIGNLLVNLLLPTGS